MEIQQRINQQRIQHIVDSYLLAGEEARRFERYLKELSSQYAPGLIELALVETLAKSWLTIPMPKGVAFLTKAHDRLKQWQTEASDSPDSQISGHEASSNRESLSEPLSTTLTPSQFSQITGLDPQSAFSALVRPTVLPTQSTIEP